MSLRHIRNVRGFFSDYYIGSAFGGGSGRGRRKKLTDRETDIAFFRFRRIRERAEGRTADPAACRERFLRPLLRDILGFHLGAGEDRVHGMYLSAEAEERGDKPLLIAYCGAWEEDLDAGRGGANPQALIEKAIAHAGLSYGFLLTGECARLIRGQGEGPRRSYLEADLAGLAEDENLASFSAFLRLFSQATFTPDVDGKTVIDEIEHESRSQAEKVSDDLKRAVFTAAESLVSGLIEDSVASGRIGSPLDLTETDLRIYRDAALTCLYRILFILYAEARDPRLDDHPLYRQSYSAQGLLDEILEEISFVWPANRSTLWPRLRALFRIYDKGLPRISQWENIPPRGSDFFSSETPEGRILQITRLSDHIISQIMLDLATSVPRPGVGRERVSFRELDIENLGAVYEGLLEFEPRLARQTTLEVRVQGRVYALSPADLIRLCEQKELSLRGDFALLAGTSCERFHPDCTSIETEEELEEENESAESELLPEENEEDKAETEDDEESVERGAPAQLIRRLEPGMFHFVPGPSRKGSGSFYTPRPLVQDLVRHALGPLIEDKTAAEIERLRILDPACGSAHFLVEAMRFLGQALHRAYVKGGNGKPPREFRSTIGQGWDSDWRASDEDARAANSESRAWCKRRIAERCLFGVDLNPTAVQLARVALWIESVAGDRPLTYFEHHVRCGNSLLGTWLERLDTSPLIKSKKKADKFLPRVILEKTKRPVPIIESVGIFAQLGIFQKRVREALAAAAALRRLIDATDSESLRREGKEPESIDEQEYKEDLRRRAGESLAVVRFLFDLRSASAFVPEIWTEWDFLCEKVMSPGDLRSYAEDQAWWPDFEKVRDWERFFHWELEFPEIFLDEGRPGFDAVLGNPPWDKFLPNRHEFYSKFDILIRTFKGGDLDKRISELNLKIPELQALFDSYRDRINIIASILKNGGDFTFNEWNIDGKSTGGHQDAFKYFVEQAWKLSAADGRIGFIVPSAIYNNEGCTGLRHLLLDETRVERFYGFENRKKIFPIDSRYKFVSLVFRKAKPEGAGFQAAFMRHDLEELDETALWREPGKSKALPGPIPWAVSIMRDELERLSPGTLAFLEYRSPRDREILLKMYESRPLLGDQGPGTWNARFYTEFNMTNDRDLWTNPKTGKLWNPRQLLGAVPGTTDRTPFYEPDAWPEIRARMAEKGFWPLYEGKHIEQFLIDIKPIERWVSLSSHEKKYGRLPDSGPWLVVRRIASNTNERTLIATWLPEKSCSNDNCPKIILDIDKHLGATIINSFVFDFALRMRGVISTLNYTHVLRLPLITIEDLKRIPIISSLSIASKGINTIYDLEEYWSQLWISNHAVAKAYGLTADDLEYILSTFPVFARKRPEFYVFLQRRVSEWKEELKATKPPAKKYPISEPSEIRVAAESRNKYKKNEGKNGST